MLKEGIEGIKDKRKIRKYPAVENIKKQNKLVIIFKSRNSINILTPSLPFLISSA